VINMQRSHTRFGKMSHEENLRVGTHHPSVRHPPPSQSICAIFEILTGPFDAQQVHVGVRTSTAQEESTLPAADLQFEPPGSWKPRPGVNNTLDWRLHHDVLDRHTQQLTGFVFCDEAMLATRCPFKAKHAILGVSFAHGYGTI